MIETANTTASLIAHQRGRWSSVWMMWDEAGKFGGWYVNLEEPWREATGGYETVDLALDLVVQPSGEWAWKDRDEFDALVAAGAIKPEVREALGVEGERLISEISAGDWVFSRLWASWTPPSIELVLPPPMT